MLVSIVVPAYNAEKYLESCIESIFSSTFRDFEVLLVDDGSTDRTGVICDELAAQYSQITVFHTENQGLADARNLGIDYAIGEFIGFVDSDDIVTPDMFDALVNAMSDNNVQMAACKFYRCLEGEPLQSEPYAGKIKFVDQSESARQILFDGYGPYAWNKLYRKDIIDTFQIRFPKHCRAFEDTYFIWNYMKYCKKAAFLESKLYFYIMHSSSITNSFRNRRVVSDACMDLPRGCRVSAEIVEKIAPELLKERVARTTMYYQTVLRKLEHPSKGYISEACDYVRNNKSSLIYYFWGVKYYISALCLCANYRLWAFIFRHGLDRAE